VPLRFYTLVQGTVLTATGRQATRARVMVAGAAATVLGTAAGAWLLGIEGVAAGRIGAEVVIAVGYAWGLGRHLARAVTPGRLWRLLPPALALGAVVLLSGSLPLLARICAGAVAYLAVALISGALGPRDIRAIFGGAW